MNLKSAPATVAIGFAGLALMVVASWFLTLSPTLGDISAAGEAHTDAGDRADTLNLQYIALRRQVDQLPETTVVARKLGSYWPPTADQPGFFAEIDNAATDAGIDVDDVTALSPGVPMIVNREPVAPPAATGATSDTPAAPAVDPNAPAPVTTRTIAVQDVTISVKGTTEQIRMFLKNMQALDRAILIESATIDATKTAEEGGGDAEDGVTLDLAGYTFVAPPLKKPTVPES